MTERTGGGWGKDVSSEEISDINNILLRKYLLKFGGVSKLSNSCRSLPNGEIERGGERGRGRGLWRGGARGRRGGSEGETERGRRGEREGK